MVQRVKIVKFQKWQKNQQWFSSILRIGKFPILIKIAGSNLKKTSNYNFSRLALNGDTIATATAAFVLKEEKKVLDWPELQDWCQTRHPNKNIYYMSQGQTVHTFLIMSSHFSVVKASYRWSRVRIWPETPTQSQSKIIYVQNERLGSRFYWDFWKQHFIEINSHGWINNQVECKC